MFERGQADVQAISFMNAHKEAILVLLRENQQFLSMTGVDECRLIISILAMTAHKVPSDDLVSGMSRRTPHVHTALLLGGMRHNEQGAELTSALPIRFRCIPPRRPSSGS